MGQQKEKKDITTITVLEGVYTCKEGVQESLVVEKMGNVEIRVMRGARLQLYVKGVKASQEKTQCTIRLVGEGAQIVVCLAEAVRSLHQAIALKMIHEASHTRAWYGVRSVLYDGARIDMDARIIIPQGLVDVDAYLSHHAIICDSESRVETIPSLEIESDEVKVGHAASVSTHDEMQRFYLESRGVDHDEVSALIEHGFLMADITHLDPALQEMISSNDVS